MRHFEKGDPGVPEEGILFGRGGGFTLQFWDFVLFLDDNVRMLNYVLPSLTGENAHARIPLEHQWVYLWEEVPVDPMRVKSCMAELNRQGFRDVTLPPPLGDQLDYLVLVERDKPLHYIQWSTYSTDAIPPEILAVYGQLREYVGTEFQKRYVADPNY